MITLTDANFEKEVLKAAVPVLVDFWAPWCGPCKIIGPILEQLAEEMKSERIVFAKMNVDENQAIPMSFGILSIPTLIIFKNGQPVDQSVGVQAKEKIAERIRKIMA